MADIQFSIQRLKANQPTNSVRYQRGLNTSEVTMEKIYKAYMNHNYRDQAQGMIAKANAIIHEYMDQGLTITLRQLYYQFVAQDLLPGSWADKRTGSTNNERSYKNLGSMITKARMSGHLPWNGMEDRTRRSNNFNSWETPAEIIAETARSFTTPKWKNMPVQPEVWVEKDALSGIIEIPAQRFQVPWMAARGYLSKDAMWRTAQRIIKRYEENRQNTVIIYLGDHDPSGLDMVRDIEEQLSVFLGESDARVGVDPIALTMQQILEHNPPPNPTKATDSRASTYIARYGNDSWELDALNPTYLVELIRDSIRQYMPDDVWKERIGQDKQGKELLRMAAIELAERWKSSN